MKEWYKSRTIVFNGLAAALIALEASTGILKPLVGDKFYLIMAGVLPVVNAFLRTVTTQSLGTDKTDGLQNTSSPS
jgi:hypothetical protein